jgi:5'-phosphate synthase pdxT subunit
MLIGILALQGNIREHRDNLKRHGVQSRYIRKPPDLDGIEGLVLPGGESTAMIRLINSSGLKEPVQGMIQHDLPVWGTCAGVVLLARGGVWPYVNIQVDRNAYGSQLNSHVVNGKSTISDKETRMVFIRSPKLRSAGANVEVLSSLNGDIVALRQRNILLTTFHPELIQDSPFTTYFINMIKMSQLNGRKRTQDNSRN